MPDPGLPAGPAWLGRESEACEEAALELVAALRGRLAPISYRCSPFLRRTTLAATGYLDHYPSIPFAATPELAVEAFEPRDWLLRPALCFQTIGEIDAPGGERPLRAYLSRGTCFRGEMASSSSDVLRSPAFDMQELVLVGPRDAVREAATAACARLVARLEQMGVDVRLEPATDHFYGPHAPTLRRVHRASQAKTEIVASWAGSTTIAVGSLNLHSDKLTSALGWNGQGESACVAFGIDRMYSVIGAARASVTPEEFVRSAGLRPSSDR